MSLVILCIKVFLVRIIDVSLGTIRTIVMIKDKKKLASFIGFIEVLVWFLVAKEAISTTSNSILIAISYSLGFATGTYLGSYLSSRYIKGNLGIQVITSNYEMIKSIRQSGYAVSVIDIKEDELEQKYMLFIEIDKKHFKELQAIIKKYDSKAFIVVNDTKYVQNGYFQK